MQNILLASHGTTGAKAAELKVLEMCNESTRVTHLIVVPEFWQHIAGDDWLNNSSTRAQFEDYVQAQLEEEIDKSIHRVKHQFDDANIHNTYSVIIGSPDKVLLDTCSKFDFDFIVIGSKRPKAVSGLRSAMLTKQVYKHLSTSLIIVPHPNA